MTILVRFLVVGLVLAGWSVAGAAPAGACSCIAGDVGRQLADADAAFVGRMLDRDAEDPFAPGRQTARFRFAVERVAKGSLGEEVVVLSAGNEAACGLGVRRGERAGVLLQRRPDGWHSGLCATVPATQLLIASAGGAPPVGDAGGGDGDGGRGLPVAGVALGLAALAAVGGAGVAWSRRRANR